MKLSLAGGNVKRLRSLIPSTRHLQVNWQQVRQRYQNLAFHGLSVEEQKKEKDKGDSGRYDAQQHRETLNTHTVEETQVLQEDSVEFGVTNVSQDFLRFILRVSYADLDQEVHLLEQDIQVCHHFKTLLSQGMLLHYMHA